MAARPHRPVHIRWPNDRYAQLFQVRKNPLPIPIPDIHDSPLFCAMVNGDWLSHVLGVLGVLGELDSWQGDDEQRDAAIQQVERLLADFAEGCAMLLLRQNPENPCQLEQSADGGDTWTLAFDYSLCVATSPQEGLLIDLLIKVNEDNLGDDYDGTPESIDPDLVYDDSANDRYRDLALCNSISLFIQLVIEVEIGNREDTLDWQDGVVAVGIHLLTAVGNALGFGAAYALFWAVYRVFAKGMIEYLKGVSTAVLSDENAIQDAKCCMFAAMLDQDPTELVFSAALDGCGFTPGSNSSELVLGIQPLLHDTDIYLSFIDSMADGLDLVKQGVVLDCTCATWSYLWLSGNGRPPYDDVIEGAYRAAEDDYYQNHVINEPPDTIRVEVVIEPPEPILATKVQWTGNIISSVIGTRMQYLDLLIAGSWWTADSSDEGTGSFTLTWNGEEVVDAVRIICRSASAGAPPRNVRVIGVTIEGQGYDPFEGM